MLVGQAFTLAIAHPSHNHWQALAMPVDREVRVWSLGLCGSWSHAGHCELKSKEWSECMGSPRPSDFQGKNGLLASAQSLMRGEEIKTSYYMWLLVPLALS